MPPYHQGPPFPVSSSPILPLDVQSTRARRPSPLSFIPLSDRHPTSSGILSNNPGPHGLASDPARSIPSDWTGDATAVCLDTSTLGPRYMQGTIDSTDNTLRSPNPLASTPAGWDVPMNLMQYTPPPQGSEGGTTLFYRSPTPSARQRTNQACEKCRDRKTKCSGGRPTCVRCQARGLICEYATEHRVRGPARTRKRIIPSFDPQVSASPTRASFAHHPYAPPAPSGHSRWDLQPISPKVRQSITAARTGWSFSDHSDESSDSSGAASFELSERTTCLQLANVQGVDFTTGQSRQGFNAIDYPNNRFHTMHRSAVDVKDRFSAPVLRPSPSMPHLNPISYKSDHSHDTPATSSGTSYPGSTILNHSLTGLSQETPLSRCPSSSSSCATRSHTSTDDEQDPSAREIASNSTIMLKSWPSTTGEAKERRDPWKAEDSMPIKAVDTEVETPKSSSQTFNVSEWITGMDYSSSPERNSSAVETETPET